MLASAAGIAVTLLNWSGELCRNSKWRYVGRVESVRHGRLRFQSVGGHTRFALPFDTVDIATLR